MKKLVLLVAIFALCAPSYGSVLVYKVTTSINPLVSFSDENETSGDVVKVKLDTFVVFDVNDNSLDVNIPADIADANDPNITSLSPDRPTAIVTGRINNKKIQMTLGGSDPNSNVFIDRALGLFDSIAPFTNTTKKKELNTQVFIEISDSDTTFDMFTEMFGKNTSADIGRGQTEKLLLAKSLKGNADIVEGAQLINGFGTAKATLDSKYTKLGNTAPGKSVSQVVAQIQADLTNKKFEVVDSIP